MSIVICNGHYPTTVFGGTSISCLLGIRNRKQLNNTGVYLSLLLHTVRHYDKCVSKIPVYSGRFGNFCLRLLFYHVIIPITTYYLYTSTKYGRFRNFALCFLCFDFTMTLNENQILNLLQGDGDTND